MPVMCAFRKEKQTYIRGLGENEERGEWVALVVKGKGGKGKALRGLLLLHRCGMARWRWPEECGGED